MTIAIADWHRLGLLRAHAADAVRAKLSRLESASTHVLHAVTLGPDEPELDYLVISPAGVFPVSVHAIHGRDVHVTNYGIRVDGQGLPFVRRAKFEAERVTRLLEARLGVAMPVRGCVVLTGVGRSLRIDADHHPIGVSVLAQHDFARWFRGQPSVLTAEQVHGAYGAALLASA